MCVKEVKIVSKALKNEKFCYLFRTSSLLLKLILLQEQTGEAWNPSKKNTLRYHDALDTKVF